jgi:hypothetical protein
MTLYFLYPRLWNSILKKCLIELSRQKCKFMNLKSFKRIYSQMISKFTQNYLQSSGENCSQLDVLVNSYH